MERDLEIKAALAEETANISEETGVGEKASGQEIEGATQESDLDSSEEVTPKDSPSS